ncbi:MAG: imidazole glycerol phosphate synthase subunit HisH [Nitriliruptoraceae bacterium]
MTAAVKVAVLDYNAGNVRSARRAFAEVGTDARITADAGDAADCDVLVVPGVGHFSSCLANLRRSGLHDVLGQWVQQQRPVFGICVGMQLLYSASEEGDEPGLGLLPGKVVRFPTTAVVPHLGWNVVQATPGHAQDALVAGVDRRRCYFTHSYYAVPDDATHVVATSTYGDANFPCLVREGSVVGTQFHPEKSGRVGMRLLENWVTQLRED